MSEAHAYAEIPPDSPDYFALLFCPSPLRRPVRELFTLERVLSALSAQTMDPTVRQAKLGWWAEEMQRVTNGQPVHPLAAAAQATLAGHTLSAEPLLELFSAVAREAMDDLPDSPESLWDHARSRGAMIALIGNLLLTRSGQEIHQAEDLLTELGRARFLSRTFGSAHVCESVGESRRGVKARNEPVLLQLLTRQRQALGRALLSTRVDQRPVLVPLLVMAALVGRELSHLAAPGNARASSPFSCLWLAWRSARQASRGKLPGWPGQGEDVNERKDPRV